MASLREGSETPAAVGAFYILPVLCTPRQARPALRLQREAEKESELLWQPGCQAPSFLSHPCGAGSFYNVQGFCVFF